MLHRLVTFILAVALGTALAGCPQHVVKIAEEVVPPRDYKPIYMTSTIPLEEAMRAYKGAAGRVPGRMDTVFTGSDDSTAFGRADASNQAGGGATPPGGAVPLRMDIRSVDDSRYPDQVELRAFVYDTSGRFVMGLAPPYFKGPGEWRNFWRTLYDSCSGTNTEIDSFTVTEVRQDRREPYAIAFVLDHSGSMGDEKILRLRTAVGRTLRIIKPGDQIATVKFGSSSFVDVPLTADTAAYRNGFSVKDVSPPGGGGTALYDATLVGIDEVSRAPATHKRAVILFTDGMDGNSKKTIEEVGRIAHAKRVTLYTVAYGQADEEVMRTMATYTGGRMYRIYSYKEFPYVFADIYRGLNNYYRITYRPPACQGVHTAKATLALNEVGYTLIARGRYDRSLFTPFDSVGSIVLVGIEFDYDRATIRPVSTPSIREVADVMRKYPKMTIEIRGHTDDRGGDDYNLKLSQDRAASVADALVGMGIERKRLSVKGFGKTRPIVPNDSDENRQKNRRTEFVITSR